jgi:hypothetical protein
MVHFTAVLNPPLSRSASGGGAPLSVVIFSALSLSAKLAMFTYSPSLSRLTTASLSATIFHRAQRPPAA